MLGNCRWCGTVWLVTHLSDAATAYPQFRSTSTSTNRVSCSAQRLRSLTAVKTVILPPEVVQDPNVSELDLAVRKLGSGALSGAISLIFTHPFDVLRRKLQVAGLSTLSPQYTGAIDCMRRSIIEEGFWRGM